ncbi:MAG: hypothetical protein NT067_05490 [Candidatus Diapherotrites archaeon]|nr:hypothetical protein [Candidatus Diapherotrites archaeon]
MGQTKIGMKLAFAAVLVFFAFAALGFFFLNKPVKTVRVEGIKFSDSIDTGRCMTFDRSSIAYQKCVYERAIKERDVMYCGIIESKALKITCTAVFTRDKEFCNTLPLGHYRSLCLAEAALAEKTCGGV